MTEVDQPVNPLYMFGKDIDEAIQAYAEANLVYPDQNMDRRENLAHTLGDENFIPAVAIGAILAAVDMRIARAMRAMERVSNYNKSHPLDSRYFHTD